MTKEKHHHHHVASFAKFEELCVFTASTVIPSKNHTDL